MKNAMVEEGGEYGLTLSIIVDVTQYNAVELQPASVGGRVIFGGYAA
jgi:hypothetical protein